MADVIRLACGTLVVGCRAPGWVRLAMGGAGGALLYKICRLSLVAECRTALVAEFWLLNIAPFWLPNVGC